MKQEKLLFLNSLVGSLVDNYIINCLCGVSDYYIGLILIHLISADINRASKEAWTLFHTLEYGIW